LVFIFTEGKINEFNSVVSIYNQIFQFNVHVSEIALLVQEIYATQYLVEQRVAQFGL